jgi:hypothetical protein
LHYKAKPTDRTPPQHHGRTEARTLQLAKPLALGGPEAIDRLQQQSPRAPFSLSIGVA